MDYCLRNPKRGGTSVFVVLLSVILGISTFAVRVCAQQAVAAGGITRLTLESRREAIECGESGAGCITPYLLCPSDNRRYSAWIATPFSRIAFSVFEALKKHERPKPWDAGDANAWGVGIYVYPSEDYDSADAIQRVLIRRGGETIEPATTTIAPLTVTSPAGVQKQLSKGFFAFPKDLFSPTSDIAIVLIGSAGELTCALDRRQLSALR